MTWDQLAPIITSVGTLIVAAAGLIAALVAALRARANAQLSREAKAEARVAQAAADAAAVVATDAASRLVEIDGQVFRLGKQVDGQLTRLLEVTETAGIAKGNIEGRAELASEMLDPTHPSPKNGGK